MFDRLVANLKAIADLGRYYALTRRPHIEFRMPAEVGEGPWIVIAAVDPLEDGGRVYGTPSHRSVRPGEIGFVFVEEGRYFLYAVQATEPALGLRAFYATPDVAVSLGEARAIAGR